MPDGWRARGRRALLVSEGGFDPRPVIGRLDGAGIAVLPAPEAAPPSEAISAHAAAADCVLLAGGDLLIDAALPALVSAGLPVGLLPSGGPNHLALALGLPLNAAAAADVIAGGHTRWIDLGAVNGRHFVGEAALGLSAPLAEALVRPVTAKLGGAVLAVRALLAQRPFTARLRCGGAIAQLRVLRLAIGVGDRRLDLTMLPAVAAWRRALLLADSQGPAPVLAFHEFTIETDRPAAVIADGAVLAETPAHFTVLPRAVAIFAPVPPVGVTAPRIAAPPLVLDERMAALGDAVMLCRDAVEVYGWAASLVDDPVLAAFFEERARERDRSAERLLGHIRDLGESPPALPPSGDMGRRLLAFINPRKPEVEREAILGEVIESERAHLARLSAGLGRSLPLAMRGTLERLRRDTQSACDRLATLGRAIP